MEPYDCMQQILGICVEKPVLDSPEDSVVHAKVIVYNYPKSIGAEGLHVELKTVKIAAVARPDKALAEPSHQPIRSSSCALPVPLCLSLGSDDLSEGYK